MCVNIFKNTVIPVCWLVYENVLLLMFISCELAFLILDSQLSRSKKKENKHKTKNAGNHVAEAGWWVL